MIPEQIFIDKDVNKIAISNSGGLDSSLMTYLLCKYITDNNLNVEVYPMHGIDNTRPTSPENVQNIINLLREQFPKVKIHDMLTWDNTKDWIVPKTKKDSAGLTKHCVENNITHIYGGRTANPPPDVMHQIGMKAMQSERIHNNDKDISERIRGGYLIRPWVNVDKKFIYDLYVKFNLLETLAPLTWSCIGFADATNFFSKPCGKCEWCKEKKWAFGYD